MAEVVKNLLGENIEVSEALSEMTKSSKEETVVIKGEVIPKKIYDLCVNHYLARQYGDDD